MTKKKIVAFFATVTLFFCCLNLNAFAAEDNYKTWLQTDPRWGSIGFGYNDGYTVAKVGCAMTSVAKVMAYSGAVSRDTGVFNPGVLCNFLKQNGGFTSSGDIYWSKPCEYTSGFTLEKWTSISGTKDEKTAQIKSFLDGGYMVVCSVKYYGHYVAVEKVENGTVKIMDPASNDITDLFYYDADGVGSNVIVYKGPKGVNSGDNSVEVPSGYSVGRYKIKSSDGVNLRSGPSTDYDRVGWLPDDTEIDVTETVGEWGKTSYNGTVGFVCLKYSEKIPDPVYTLYMEIISKPNKTVYSEGEDFDSTGLSVKMHYSDGTGEIFTSGFELSGYASSPGTHTVTVSMWGFSCGFEVTVNQNVKYLVGTYSITSSNGVNVRSAPSSQSGILGGLGFDEKIRAYEVYGEWGKIDYGGQTGYVCLKYAKCLSSMTLRGDANGDCSVTVNDALAVVQYCVGKIRVTDIDIAGADADLSGIIDMSDAILTLQIAVGKA